MAEQDQALQLTVVDNEDIGGLFQRLTLTCEALDAVRIGERYHGLHVKLFFKKKHQAKLVLPRREDGRIVWPVEEEKPASRTYSVFEFNASTKQVQIDFLMHQDSGIASDFAKNAKSGDVVGFAGPVPMRMIDPSFQQFLLICDLTGLPAVASVLTTLPENANVIVVIELEEDEQLNRLKAHYSTLFQYDVKLVKWDPYDKSLLLNELTLLDLQSQIRDWSVAVAAEHNSVISVRKFLRDLQLPQNQLYAIPYWRYQQDEETYHEQRHEVIDT